MAKVKAMDGQTDKYFKQFFISGASSFTSFSAKKKKEQTQYSQDRGAWMTLDFEKLFATCMK